eukprot:scaffold45188_cov33-Attheya_sp.AAC.2
MQCNNTIDRLLIIDYRRRWADDAEAAEFYLENDTDSRTYGDLRRRLRCYFERKHTTEVGPNYFKVLVHASRRHRFSKIQKEDRGWGLRTAAVTIQLGTSPT